MSSRVFPTHPTERQAGLGRAAESRDRAAVQVANWTVPGSAAAPVAQAFDYVHSLVRQEATRVHVLTCSMRRHRHRRRGLDAVNLHSTNAVSLSSRRAGNDFANLPTRFVCLSARCQHASSPPASVIGRRTALYRPACDPQDGRVLWARAKRPDDARGLRRTCRGRSSAAATSEDDKNRDMIDLDGGGARLPRRQIAWRQQRCGCKGTRQESRRYPEDWMRVEADPQRPLSSRPGRLDDR